MRLRSVVAFGIGYVLGTKAGRDRYKDLLQTGQELSQSLRELTSSSAVAQDVVSKVRQTLGLPPLEHGVSEGGGSSGGQGEGRGSSGEQGDGEGRGSSGEQGDGEGGGSSGEQGDGEGGGSSAEPRVEVVSEPEREQGG